MGEFAEKKRRLQHFGKSNRFGVPAPKPGAIPNFAKPGYEVEDFAVVVKYVVKEILPHFRETFKSGDWGKLGRNRGVRNISDSRTGLVFRLPNQARYQTSLSPDIRFWLDGFAEQPCGW